MALNPSLIVVTAKSGVLPPQWKRIEFRAGSIVSQLLFFLFWMTLMTFGFTLGLSQHPTEPWVIIGAGTVYLADLYLIFFAFPQTVRKRGTTLILTPEGFVVWNQRTDAIELAIDYQECAFLTSVEDSNSEGPNDFFIRYRIQDQESRWQIPRELKGNTRAIAEHIVNAYAIIHPQPTDDLSLSSPMNLNVAGFYGHIVAPPTGMATPNVAYAFDPLAVLKRINTLSPDASWKIYPTDFTPRFAPWLIPIIFACPLVLCCGFFVASIPVTVNDTKIQIPGVWLWVGGAIVTMLVLVLLVRPIRSRNELLSARANSPLSQGNILVLTPEGFVLGNPVSGNVINWAGFDQIAQINVVLGQGVSIMTKGGRAVPIAFTSYFQPPSIPILGTEIVQAYQRYREAAAQFSEGSS